MSKGDDGLIHVRVQGTCPSGHTVVHDLPVRAVKGSHGFATANANCGSCHQPVHMSGTYTTTG